jgi:hypothetical protein
MQSVEDIQKKKLLEDFKRNRATCPWVIPMNLKPYDIRDLQISKGEIYGIEKTGVPDGFDYEKEEINKNLAKLAYLELVEKFNSMQNKTGYTWTIFDNLDKAFCLKMAVHYESKLDDSDQPFNREISQFLKIQLKNNVTVQDKASQWQQSKLRNRRKALASIQGGGGGRQELPPLLARLNEVAAFIGPFINSVRSVKDMLRLLKTRPISKQEGHLFRVPICRVNTIALEYKYVLDILRTAVFNNTKEGMEAISKLSNTPSDYIKRVFVGDAFGSNPQTPQSTRSVRATPSHQQTPNSNQHQPQQPPNPPPNQIGQTDSIPEQTQQSFNLNLNNTSMQPNQHSANNNQDIDKTNSYLCYNSDGNVMKRVFNITRENGNTYVQQTFERKPSSANKGTNENKNNPSPETTTSNKIDEEEP